MIRIYKIKAMLYRDIVSFAKTKERIVEFLFFPVTTTVIWGLFSNYFKAFSLETAMMLLIINIFWSFTYLSQSSGNLQINMDVWSRSLTQLLISGISELEYLVSRLVFSTVASIPIVILMLWIAGFFGFVMPALAPFTFLIIVCLLASTVLGIFVVSLFILLGRDYAFLSWTFLQLIILLSAPFFPIQTYPWFIQKITVILPHTWIFECLRNLASTGVINTHLVMKALITSMIYLFLVLPLYLYVFKRAKKTGSLIRLVS